jgi:hypothetical protein
MHCAATLSTDRAICVLCGFLVSKHRAMLGLDDFEQYRPRLRQYLANHMDYETNTYDLTPEQRAIVTERWGEVIDRYRIVKLLGRRDRARRTARQSS